MNLEEQGRTRVVAVSMIDWYSVVVMFPSTARASEMNEGVDGQPTDRSAGGSEAESGLGPVVSPTSHPSRRHRPSELCRCTHRQHS
jgi:hypothetical protein